MSYTGLNASFIESLPPELLKIIPAADPPRGIIPNFEHPSTLLSVILSTLIIFLLPATISYVIRVYMKAIVLKNWRWDDTMVTLGFLFTCLYLSATIGGSVYGIIGIHLWEVHVDRVITKVALYADYVISVSIIPSLGFVKLSFLMQFYYLFKPLRWLRLSCWIGGSFIAFVYAGATIVSFALNSPWPREDILADLLSWHYLAGSEINIPTGVFGLATDLFVLVLPIPAVMGLQLALRKKIGILLVFSLGIIAVVSSTMNLYNRISLFQNTTDKTDADPDWIAGSITIWTQIELLAGITAANMPVVHQFFVRKNIIQRLRSGKISASFKSILSRSRHTKSGSIDDTNALTDSFDSHRHGAPFNTKVEPEMSETTDWKYGSHSSETQITVSQDYSVTSHAL